MRVPRALSPPWVTSNTLPAFCFQPVTAVQRKTDKLFLHTSLHQTLTRFFLRRWGLLSPLASGDITLLPRAHNDVPGIQDVLTRFHDQEIDRADACLIRLAEREGIEHVFTLDRRHFFGSSVSSVRGEARLVSLDFLRHNFGVQW